MYKDFLQELLKTNIIASLFIITLLIFKGKLQKRYSHGFLYILTIIISLRFLAITTINLYIPKEIYETIDYQAKRNVISIINTSIEKGYKIDFMPILFYLWIIVATTIFVYYLYFNVVFYFKIKSGFISIQVENETLGNILKTEKLKMSIDKKIKVRIVKSIDSPALIGFINPKIIIPETSYSEKELTWIIRHELVHYKRKDNYIKVILTLVSALNFFNPLVYILKDIFYKE